MPENDRPPAPAPAKKRVITLRILPAIHWQVRSAAFGDGKSINQWLEQLVLNELQKRKDRTQ